MATLDALIVTDLQAEQLAIINEVHTHQCEPLTAADGRKVLPASYLDQIGHQDAPGYWYDHGYLFLRMEQETVEMPPED